MTWKATKDAHAALMERLAERAAAEKARRAAMTREERAAERAAERAMELRSALRRLERTLVRRYALDALDRREPLDMAKITAEARNAIKQLGDFDPAA